MKDDQTATVTTKFNTAKRKTAWITFTLKLSDGKWQIDGGSEEREPPEGFDLSVRGRIYP